jgi:hypothetical protein
MFAAAHRAVEAERRARAEVERAHVPMTVSGLLVTVSRPMQRARS